MSKRDDLKARAEELGIEFDSSIKNGELEALIKDAEAVPVEDVEENASNDEAKSSEEVLDDTETQEDKVEDTTDETTEDEPEKEASGEVSVVSSTIDPEDIPSIPDGKVIKVTLPSGIERVYSNLKDGAVYRTLAKNFAEANKGKVTVL